MINKKCLEKLEYDKILNLLQNYASTYLGKQLCLNLIPSFEKNKVIDLLTETEEAINILNSKSTIPNFILPDTTYSLKKLQDKVSLSQKDLFEFATILKCSRILYNYFIDDTNNKDFVFKDLEIFPNIIEKLYSNPSLENNILSKILDENTLDDHASQELYSIRVKKRNLINSIKERLNSIIHSSSNSKYLQEAVITIRNDRYVIPVKEEFRGYIKGFIHDFSSTGATIFIEPTSIFDLNNELNNLKNKENIEIEHILLSLSNLLFPLFAEIKQTINTIGYLDFIFAKAKFAIDINANKPIIGDKKQFTLNSAKHPLINKDIVVPISINLGNDFSTLVVTGPNTGGKTVTLKTVGLLLVMAYSGLYITTDEDSTIFVFDNIFISIGDDQSLQASLSTFSSLMTNIIQIINESTSNSLILLDELGTGTDPIEGASLALSILEHFYNKNVLTIATTHYSEIKEYAIVTNGFENACVEFNIDTLMPTYKLLIGIPGKSNAFAISKKLGLSENILKRANDFMKPDIINIEELLKEIYDNKSFIEAEKDKIIKTSNQIDLLKKDLENKLTNFNTKKDKLIDNANAEARRILQNAKEQVSVAIKNLNEVSSAKDLNNIRNDLNVSIKNTHKTNTNNIENKKTNKNLKPISKGDTVLVTTLNKEGTVLTDVNRSNQVQVLVGVSKLNINVSELEFISSNSSKSQTKATVSSNRLQKNKSVPVEINVIGNNVEEAIFVIDKYLDDCVLSNLTEARIVHGKGTGALKNGIHLFLKKHPHVESFRLGTYGEGETGVTIVTLKGKHN